MSFHYLISATQWFKQGEIIENLYEFRPKPQESETIDLDQPITVDAINYPYTIIISQECDLKQDYETRFDQIPDGKQLEHILLCGLLLEDEIRTRPKLKSDIFRRIRQNQDERYHHFIGSKIGETEQVLPDLYADFIGTFSLPLEFMYSLVDKGLTIRKGVLPTPFLEDFIHRLYSFLGRVATPEIQETIN